MTTPSTSKATLATPNNEMATDKGIAQRMVETASLTDEQQGIFDYIVEKKQIPPLFVSGAAGTGKSLLLRRLLKELPEAVCLAYTNMAARNIGGATLHKFFGLTLDMRFRGRMPCFPKIIFIDEISMVPGSFMDRFDVHARKQYMADPSLPFGGITVVVFGDMYQLPPITPGRDENSPPDYPFRSDVWKCFTLYELTRNLRQTEEEFIGNLNLLRTGDVACLEFFNNLVVRKMPTRDEAQSMTNLVATRREAKEINDNLYAHLRSSSVHEDQEEYKSVVVNTGYFNYRDLQKTTPVYPYDQFGMIYQPDLPFCVGTRIMCTANSGNHLNGDIGTIVKIEKQGAELIVTMNREYDGVDVTITNIERHFKRKHPVVGLPIVRFRGLPFTHGWACTIHKAQGMTLRNLIVIPNSVFMEAQAYVALSRVTHSSGLRLLDRIPPHFVLSVPLVDEMYKSMQRLSL